MPQLATYFNLYIPLFRCVALKPPSQKKADLLRDQLLYIHIYVVVGTKRGFDVQSVVLAPLYAM